MRLPDPDKVSEPKTVWVGKDFGKEKKYGCKYCSATFARYQSLGAHVTAHHTRNEEVLEWVIGERRNWKDEGRICPYGCGFKSHSPRELAKHIMATHKKEVEANIAKFRQR